MADDETGVPEGRWTRRRFLEAMAATGGAAALYPTGEAVADVPPPADGEDDVGQGRSVLVLGAGVGGMATAILLMRRGFSVTLLEAQGRTGGRSHTLRHGDRVIEVRNGVREEQVCRMDEGLYFNAGPGRIPQHHTTIIRWCRELGVELEPYIMETRANLFQTPRAFQQAPVQNRQVANDTRGWLAAMLYRLAPQVPGVDAAALRELLLTFGALDGKEHLGEYRGSSRSGYTDPPGVESPGTIREPLRLEQLLQSRFWDHKFYQPEEWEWQPTLFEPRGGMDMIERALARQLGGRIRLNRQVVRVETVPGAVPLVRVTHRNAATGADQQQMTAHFCVSTIPLPILARTANNFSEDFRRAIAAVPFAPTCKVGWQADSRFWEEDDQIYGGISYIDHPITQMWYPSSGFFSRKGVLTGAYNYDADAVAYGRMSPAQRLENAAAGATLLHPQFGRSVPRDRAITIAWQNVPFQEGGWSDWKPDQVDEYNRLLCPEANVFWVAGDQMSYLPGWQEGAALSARYVAGRISGPTLLGTQPPRVRRAPDARAVVQGHRQ